MQEVVEEKSVSLAVRGTKMTGRLLAKAIRALYQKAKNNKNKAPIVMHGKQSLKSLSKDGSSLSTIEITDKNIGSFKKTARKYNVDFSLKRDNSLTPPKWLVFFKAKDADSLTAAFKEYSNKILKTKELKPSMLTKLNKFKELSKSAAAPVKSRNRGGHEL
jgi:predicted RNA binding protein with dsRBD fold (UPF0201 family)